MRTLHGNGPGARQSWRWSWLICALLLLTGPLVLPTPATAQDEGKASDPKYVGTGTMQEWVYKELGQAQEKAEASDYAEALRLLDKLMRKDLNSYERSQSWNLYAYIYYSQERYPQAIEAYKRVMEEEDAVEALKTAAIYSLSQLYFASEQWQRAIESLRQWFALVSNPKPQHYELLAQAHYQLEEYRKALVPLKRAIALRREAGEPIRERNHLLLRVIYFELDELDEVARVLEKLILHFPGEIYWMQLAGIYGQLGHERKRLNTLELAYLQGFLDSESEVLALAGLMLNDDLPYRAGKVLEKGLGDGSIQSTMKHWRLLSQAWLSAREDQKAIPALIRAADMSANGELDILLAQSYINLADWEQAAKSARKGIGKGGLPRQDQAYVMLGQVLFYMNAFDESRDAFEQASRDDRSRNLANRWLKYVDSEKAGQAQLKAALEGG